MTPKLYKEDGMAHVSPLDEIFTYNREDTGEQLHFNCGLMERVRQHKPHWFWKQDMDITQEIYDLVLSGRGIEEKQIASFTPERIDKPGLGVMLNDEVHDDKPNLFVLIDGNHRLVKRFRMGLRSIDVWITLKPVWEKCLMHPIDAETDDFLRKLVPPLN